MNLEQYEKKPKESEDDDSGVDKDKTPKPAAEPAKVTDDSMFTKPLTDVTVPEHKLAVFETAVSDVNAQVVWFFNGQQVDQMATKKRFGILSLGNFRRLNVRNCLLHESDSVVTCKWAHLETTAKLFLVGKYSLEVFF